MKKVRLAVIAALMAFAMIFTAACGGGNNGGTAGDGTGTGTGGSTYAALFEQAHEALENAGHEVVVADEAALAIERGLVPDAIAAISVIDVGYGGIVVILRPLSGGLTPMVTPLVGTVAARHRIVFYGCAHMVDIVIDAIGGEIFAIDGEFVVR